MNPNDPHRDEELQDAPWLRSLKPAADVVPEGYFKDFNDRLKARIEASEELDEAPQLRAAGKPEPPVTAGYFEALPDRIMARIRHRPAGKVRAFPRLAWLPVSLAAAFALLLLGWWAWPRTTQAPSWTELSDEALVYLLEAEPLDTELLLASLDDKSLQSLERRYRPQLSDEDLLDALEGADLYELEQEWEDAWPESPKANFSDSIYPPTP